MTLKKLWRQPHEGLMLYALCRFPCVSTVILKNCPKLIPIPIINHSLMEVRFASTHFQSISKNASDPRSRGILPHRITICVNSCCHFQSISKNASDSRSRGILPHRITICVNSCCHFQRKRHQPHPRSRDYRRFIFHQNC